ncbi:Histone deacetylase complex subunit [Marasmius crinis-equi]|uniref:Histone deacetylase complex subunit n=1 Tax=Marasmius crinis-equi TaxID=585013 RepID=A0ABR3F3K7_9AGAR
MTQASSMGPPLSPRETRRSGRRSAPSVSTSNSKSPDSDPPQRPPLTSTTSGGGRNKRLKQEDADEPVVSVISTNSNNGRGKRKSKEKPSHQQPTPEETPDNPVADPSVAPPEEEEEQGITRCVCGSTGEDDPDAGEFMVQCEICKVWQHGLCMGFDSEDQLHDDDYYCEQCRPEMHVELLKRLAKKVRHSSSNSHNTNAAPNSRLSRSHSPSHLKQPSKRRNTMNSRDAAFDENLKEILESTAAEAEAVPDAKSVTPSGNPPTSLPDAEESVETAPANRKKRKRVDNDAPPAKKRTRSMSTTSDHPAAAAPSLTPREETPTLSKPPAPTNTTTQKPAGRNKRGGGRKAAATQEPVVDADGVPVPTSKRQGNGGRSKNAGGSKRPPQSTAGAGSHEPSSRRGQANASGVGQHAGSTAMDSSRAHRNTHAYLVSQQPLFTSWGLPDYLGHLEALLPTEVPKPLEVASGVTGRGDSIERTMERGVKVKWPGKRMSVVDMNKRVRALVEWVGREQASASDRARRREVLEKALKENAQLNREVDGAGTSGDGMVIDSGPRTDSPSAIQSADDTLSGGEHSSLMKDMEKLMTDLITFQERFGPGVKSRDRERRHAS